MVSVPRAALRCPARSPHPWPGVGAPKGWPSGLPVPAGRCGSLWVAAGPPAFGPVRRSGKPRPKVPDAAGRGAGCGLNARISLLLGVSGGRPVPPSPARPGASRTGRKKMNTQIGAGLLCWHIHSARQRAPGPEGRRAALWPRHCNAG